MRRNVQSVLFGNKTCDNFFNHFFYSLIILRSSLRCILEKWYRLVSFDHATFPHQEERTVEENCEQPDGRYRYVQKNLDEGYARKILCWSSSAKSMDNVVKASLTLLSAIFNVYVGYTILDIPTPMPRIIQGSRIQQEEPTWNEKLAG